MFAWNKMAVTQSCLFYYAVYRESSSFTSKCYRNKGKTKEMFKFKDVLGLLPTGVGKSLMANFLKVRVDGS